MDLAAAWGKLPAKEQEALAMWSFEGLEPNQIAVSLGISTNAVNVRLSRAKKNLLAELEKSQGSNT